MIISLMSIEKKHCHNIIKVFIDIKVGSIVPIYNTQPGIYNIYT